MRDRRAIATSRFDWAHRPDLVAQLRKLIEVEGLSYLKASRVMGCTRHQAIGCGFRHGFRTATRDTGGEENRPAKIIDWAAKLENRRKRQAAARAKPKSPILAAVKPKVVLLPHRDPDGKLYTTLTISDATCKWPYGDPCEETMYYCGHTPKLGTPYCPTHCIQSAAPVQSGRSKRNLSTPAEMARMFGGL